MDMVQQGRGTILIVDTGTAEYNKIAGPLQKQGFSVISPDEYTAEGGPRGMSPDLVLVIMSGRSAAADMSWGAVSELVRDFKVPVVILSSYAEEDLYRRAYTAGARSVICAPVSAEFLASRIGEIMEPGETTSPDTADPDMSRMGAFLLSILGSISRRDRSLRRIMARRRRDGLGIITGPKNTELSKEENETYLALRTAIRNNEFVLYYQPIVSLSSGRITGFEALIRWRRPEKGVIAPDGFIPLAEKTDLIIAIGMWVIEEASRQLARWQKAFPADPPLTVSVNISARQFVQHELTSRIEEIITLHGLDPSTVRLEITESAFMEDMDAANIMLLELKSKKFQLYMDDFGTGYSSLSYLMHFPVDVLKIDKSFVRFMHVDEESEVIVHSVIALAHNLKRLVVAEGVETVEHYEILKELGCDYGQGYFFSRPVDAAAAEDMLVRKTRW